MRKKSIYFTKILFFVILTVLIFNVNSVYAIDLDTFTKSHSPETSNSSGYSDDEPSTESDPDHYDYNYDDDDGNDGDDNDGDDDDDDDSHNSGKDCLQCHNFKIAGTVYTNSAGTTTLPGATVKITSNNVSNSFTTDRSGNFSTTTSFSGTYSVTVSYGTNQASMVGKASYGGCNTSGCHSAGSSTGRVYVNDSFNISTGTLTGYVYSTSTAAASLSYNSDIKTILDNKCILCHVTGGLRSASPLTTYSGTLNVLSPGNANSSIITKTATGGSMASYLTQTEALKIKNWVVDYNAAETSTTSSGVVVGAIVTLGTASVTTGSDGKFTFSGIAAGIITMTVTATGYAQSSSQVTIVGGKTTTQNVTLASDVNDVIAPTNPSIIVANGLSSTDEISLTLTLSASDNVGITAYYASEIPTTPSASASGWVSVTSAASYSGTVPFVIGTEQGTKTVYVWFKDSKGNMSSQASDTIVSNFIPTLSEWGMLLFISMLLFSGVVFIAKPRTYS